MSRCSTCPGLRTNRSRKPTSGSDILLTLTVTDPDSDVAGLEVRLNDTTLTLDDDGTYEGVFLISEGAIIRIDRGNKRSNMYINDDSSVRSNTT